MASRSQMPDTEYTEATKDGEPGGVDKDVEQAGVDLNRNERFAFGTLRARYADELLVLRRILAERGVPPDDPGAPAEWGDAHLLRFALGFGSGEAAAEAFCRSAAWLEQHGGAARRARFAAGALLRFRGLGLMRQLAPMQRIGLDRHGCPVIVHYLGQLKPRQLVAAFSHDQIRRFNVLATERTYAQLQGLSAADRVLRRSVLVLDMGGVGLNMLAPRALGRLRSVVSELTQVYVEMVEKVFFVRVPLAGWVESIACSLSPERSHHKFAFLGADFVGELSRHVPLDQLPEPLLTGRPPVGGWGLQEGDVDSAGGAGGADGGEGCGSDCSDAGEFADAHELL